MIVFDFDGVLADTPRVKTRAYYDIFATFEGSGSIVDETLSLPETGDRFVKIRRIVGELIEQEIMKTSAGVDDPVSFYADRYNDICEEYASTCREIPGAAIALESLSTRYPLYINSATPLEPLTRILRRRGWMAYINTVFGSSGSKAEVLGTILKRERIEAGDLLYIGDQESDQVSAHEIGCHFLGVTYSEEAFSFPPDCAVDNLIGLSDRIPSLELSKAS